MSLVAAKGLCHRARTSRSDAFDAHPLLGASLSNAPHGSEGAEESTRVVDGDTVDGAEQRFAWTDQWVAHSLCVRGAISRRSTLSAASKTRDPFRRLGCITTPQHNDTLIGDCEGETADSLDPEDGLRRSSFDQQNWKAAPLSEPPDLPPEPALAQRQGEISCSLPLNQCRCTDIVVSNLESTDADRDAEVFERTRDTASAFVHIHHNGYPFSQIPRIASRGAHRKCPNSPSLAFSLAFSRREKA